MQKVKFEEVVRRINENVDKENTHILFYVAGEHIESNEFLIHDKGLIEGSTIGYKFHYGFRPGNILFMSRNPHLRKASMVEFEGVCSDSTYVVETKNSEVLLQEYLMLEMQSDRFWNWMEEHKTGGVNYLINYRTLNQYEFKLPPVEVQREIADKAWAAYRLKEAYKRLLAATDEMVKSQFIEMFSGFPLISTIGKECQVCTGSTPPRNHPEYWNGNFPWVSAQDMGDKYIKDTLEKITEEGKLTCKIIPAGSIIYVCRGSIGVQSITNIECATNQSICTATCGRKINNEFLYTFLTIETEKVKKEGIGTSFKSINQKDFSNIQIPLPPMELQEEFAAIVRQSDKSKFELKRAIEAINQVIKSLING